MANDNYTFTAAFVDALAGMGLRHVCISPGSRSSPLAVPFAAHAGITDWIHHDERSAAFFALGLARATRSPVAVVTTSGTAAAELHPAVIEADLSRVPLLLFTADRPPELRDVGAPQAIDQIRLFGSAVRWFHETATPTGASIPYATQLAARAWTSAADLPPGPVHLNFPFREPLEPPEVALDEQGASRTPFVGRGALAPEAATIDGVAHLLSDKRTLVVAGPQDQAGFAAALATLAAAGKMPIIADPLSQMRAGPFDRSRVVTTGDALARTGLLDGGGRPEAVLRFGAPPTSKAITTWLAAHPEIPQVVVEEAGWRDPGASVAMLVRSNPLRFVEMLTGVLPPAPEGWAATWMSAEQRARTALTAATGFPTEPGVVIALAKAIGDGTQLYVGSSMPIRDVDTFFPSMERRVRFLANRGANGIDGLVSAGSGSAATGTPTIVLAGDLALLHDLTALGTAARLALPVTIVVINNDGGGIFHFLPQAGFPEYFERLLGTPHGTDFRKAAALFGIEHHQASDSEDLSAMIGRPIDGPRLLEVRTDRAANVAVHEAAWRAVAVST